MQSSGTGSGNVPVSSPSSLSPESAPLVVGNGPSSAVADALALPSAEASPDPSSGPSLAPSSSAAVVASTAPSSVPPSPPASGPPQPSRTADPSTTFTLHFDRITVRHDTTCGDGRK